MIDFIIWMTDTGTNQVFTDFFWNNLYVFGVPAVYLTYKYPNKVKKILDIAKKVRVSLVP